MKKKVFKLFQVMCVTLMLTACGSSNGSDGDVTIGFNFDLTGAGAQYGEAELDGAKLALKIFNENGGFNGKEVKFISLDSKSDQSEAYQAQTKLAEDGVFAIVGATISSTSAQAILASEEQKVPTVTPSATADKVTNDGTKGIPYGYRVCYADSFQGLTMANFAVNEKGFKKIGIIADNSSDYAKGLVSVFKAQLESLGGQVVVEEYYSTGETDFSTILTKIRGNTDIEALFIPGYYNEVGTLIKQARGLGVDYPILGVDGYDSAELINLATAEALNNVYYSNHYSNTVESKTRDNFVELFKAEYGKEPAGFQALAFDATNLVLEALVKAGKADPEAVNAAIESTKGFEGVTGTISIDSLHNAEKSTFVLELKDGVEVEATIVAP
ncbi:hypothetical protein AOC36_05260 [Erysipelothrix larvae]|uniref:Leucine-binding protein domain-containing protein n=1 Tax=Erysipelothrix larvae TaxID=1514105 RepID=A0A109UGY7_9FIRM|nr:ABC transporter substrate-binding protein [Erysipelothrix larvae]AMC93407.1 hypothetical protein AOC36_05260 [Erysipelothrix larvae]